MNHGMDNKWGPVREMALFAGAGGGILGGHILGWRTCVACELAEYPSAVLCARQNEGLLPPFPVWDDIRTFDARPFRGLIDVVSGGFPCQDISLAGTGAGIQGERSGLWQQQSRVIGEVLPPFAFIENSPALTLRGLDRVLADLAALGYDAEWIRLGALDVGAPHIRWRLWILAAHSAGPRLQGAGSAKKTGKLQSRRGPAPSPAGPDVHHSGGERHGPQNEVRPGRDGLVFPTLPGDARYGLDSFWRCESGVLGMVDGVANRVDRVKAVGNGQVPHVAAVAWCTLYYRLFGRKYVAEDLFSIK